MKQITRRSLVVGVASMTLGTGGGGQVVSDQHYVEDDIRQEQSRYLQKHGSERASIYDSMEEVFNPPDQEDYEDKFTESLIPTASSLVPGIVGDAIELQEKLRWYYDILEKNKFDDVSRFGIIENIGDTPDGRGSRGEAMEKAKAELQKIKTANDSVQQRAEIYENSPTDDSKEALIKALESEREAIRAIHWINEWTAIEPNFYEDVTVGDATEGASLVRDNAEVTVEILAAIETELTEQIERLNSNELAHLPEMIVLHNSLINDIDLGRSEAILNRFTGDSFNIRVETLNGKLLYVDWVTTNNNGKIYDYSLTKESNADADISLSKSTVDDIQKATDPYDATLDAYDRGEINVSGNGYINSVKYSSSDILYQIIRSVL